MSKFLFGIPYAGVMGCGAAEGTGLGFICFVVLNPGVLSYLNFHRPGRAKG